MKMQNGLLLLLLLTFVGISWGSEKKEDHGAMDAEMKEDEEMNGSEDASAKAEEEPEEMPEEESSKDKAKGGEENSKNVKNFTCQVTGALLAMAESIKELDKDIQAIKAQMFEKCPGFHVNSSDSLDEIKESLDSLNSTDDKTKLENEDEADDLDGEDEEKLPLIPTECDKPFQPVANSCYYFLYYPSDWRNWGDANAYCQNLGGTLAAPHRVSDLRKYLKINFSNVFWVGAKKTDLKKNIFHWLNGKEVSAEDWSKGKPSNSAAKHCVYLEFFFEYKAINHYCGEKFSFVCEKREDA